jgi:hypothetical protein
MLYVHSLRTLLVRDFVEDRLLMTIDAFKIPPFSLWTLWYAILGVLTDASPPSRFGFFTVLSLILIYTGR